MAKSKCSRKYHKMAADKLDLFTEEVRQGQSSNPTVFTAPPYTDAQYDSTIEAYVIARAAYKTGGSAQKPGFVTAKAALMKVLDDTADSVDEVADGDANIIILGRFTPTKVTSSDKPAPVKPENIKMKRGETTEMYMECGKVEGAETYGCILVAYGPLPDGVGFNASGQFLITNAANPTPPPPPVPGSWTIFALDVNKSRKKKFMNLVKGVTYWCYFYAANANGVSPLSDGVSLMCG